MALKLG
jgi:hypothetical protein